MVTPCLKLFSRSSSISTSLQRQIDNLSLTDQKITQLMTQDNRPDIAWNRLPKVPLEQKYWEKTLPILIIPQKKENSSMSNFDYYFGGLPALMQAARKLLNDPQALCVYVYDGVTPKSLLSGHQAHVHPTEWPTPDCQILNLCKVFFRGMGVIPSPSPHDLRSYTYLHFPISRKEIRKNPAHHFKLYGFFFINAYCKACMQSKACLRMIIDYATW